MPSTTINGIDLDTRAASIREVPEYIGSVFERSINGNLIESRVAEKRRFTFETITKTPAEARAWAALLSGKHDRWTFPNHAYSAKGLGFEAGASFTQNANDITIASAGSVQMAMAKRFGDTSRDGWAPTKGFTVYWYNISGGGLRFIATGDVAWSRGTANPSGVTQYWNGSSGSHSFGHQLAISAAGVIALHGYALSGVADPVRLDDVVVLPFELPDSDWASDLDTFMQSNEWPASPWLELTGDAVGGETINVVGRVRELQHNPIVLDGTFYSDALALSAELLEV